MSGNYAILLTGFAAAFCAGMMFATAIMIGKLPRSIRTIIEWRRLRSLRMSDDWDRAPWRDM